MDQQKSGKAQVPAIPKPLSNLAWIVILVSCAGIGLFPLADFGGRNVAYYLNAIGNYVSFASPVLLMLLVSLVWRGYRKRIPISKAAWLQMGLLALLTVSVAVAYGT